MPRLYLTLFILLVMPLSLLGQVKLKDLVQFADEQYKKGDYYYAIDFYKKAIAIDSNSLELKWKYAETLRAYKSYKEAEKLYAEIYAREEAETYPESILYLGLMQKQNGKYQKAIETFKLAKTHYDDKESYNYKKSNREVESCYWALKNTKDTIGLQQFHERINSFDAEFGHHYSRGVLIFSSLKADTTHENEEVYGRNYTNALYYVNTSDDSISKAKKILGLAEANVHTGNANFSKSGHYLYFSICEDDGYNYRCKIARSVVKNGVYGKADTLPFLINHPNSNTTNPMEAEIDGKPYLFFASNRPGTRGAMDIWYSEIISDTEFGAPVNLSAINSIDNEICPWYDTIKNQLYFSSTWHNGLGGYDVFMSKKIGEKFEKPINLKQPINGPANDLYYFESEDSIFVSSNRLGSFSKKNPTCCSDIYFSKIERPINPPDSTPVLTKRIDFPIRLFFKNDHPNPTSLLATTKLSYETTYLDYKKSFEEYLTKVNDDSIKINNDREVRLENFFSNSVDKGYNDLLMLSDSIELHLAQKKYVTLFVKGFASPLHQTNYNIRLSKRRINSFYNYLSSYKNGLFKSALELNKNNEAQLQIIEIPFGEYAANQLTSDDFNDQKNSVYSYEASIERKIEIIGMEVANEKRDSMLYITPSILYLNEKNNTVQEINFFIENLMVSEALIDTIEVNSPALKITEIPTMIAAKKGQNIKLQFTQPKEKGLYLFTIDIKVRGIKMPIRAYASIEIK
jgi:tetratricopeptide (TPR) repeat protein